MEKGAVISKSSGGTLQKTFENNKERFIISDISMKLMGYFDPSDCPSVVVTENQKIHFFSSVRLFFCPAVV